MKPRVLYCPGCGAEAGERTTFCRKCGTNLQVVDRALNELQPAAPLASGEGVDPIVRELKQDLFWKTIRGILTLVLAVPVFLVLAFGLPSSFFYGRGPDSTEIFLKMLPTLFFLVFVILGIRDLSTAYSSFKNPAAALKELREKNEEKRLECTSVPLEPTIRSDREAVDSINARGSITEHTTFDLKDQSNATGSSSTGRLD